LRPILLIPAVLLTVATHAQSIGSVSRTDATVTNAGPGMVETSATTSTIGPNSLVVANGHTAPILLVRGGEIRLCQTTSLHITGSPDQSMLLAIDHGAVEFRLKANPNDIVMTPDLQFTFADPGLVNLDMRVTTNGDTCVENRGRRAPTLKISDLFGQSSYELKAGQHVLFEHGSLREVVDKETTPCGCPPDTPNQRSGSLADAALAGGKFDKKPNPAQAAASEHPFPVAESEGLASPPPIPAETPGRQPHVQVATTLGYDPNAPKPTQPDEASPAATPASAPTQEPLAAPRSHNPFTAVGHFFKRLFVR
jgi:hypothetical protein